MSACLLFTAWPAKLQCIPGQAFDSQLTAWTPVANRPARAARSRSAAATKTSPNAACVSGLAVSASMAWLRSPSPPPTIGFSFNSGSLNLRTASRPLQPRQDQARRPHRRQLIIYLNQLILAPPRQAASPQPASRPTSLLLTPGLKAQFRGLRAAFRRPCSWILISTSGFKLDYRVHKALFLLWVVLKALSLDPLLCA